MKKILLIISIYLPALFAYAQIIVPPYCDDFENGAPGWYANSNTASVWQLDTFNNSSGNHVWGMGLNGIYAPNTIAFLYSSVFDFTAITNPSLCFWQRYETEIYQDGMRVEYSVNGGTSWQILGGGGQSGAPYFWYNSFIISSSGMPGWTGTMPVWQHPTMSLDSLSGNSMVQFRFVFTSNANSVGFGHLIDDFCICDSLTCNCFNMLGMTEQPSENQSFYIYPNPANDQVTIEMKKNSPHGKIVLFDIMGKEILNQKISNIKTIVDLKNISEGVYFISVENDGKNLKSKIAVIH